MPDRSFKLVQTLLAIALASGIAVAGALWLVGHPLLWFALAIPGLFIILAAWRVSALKDLVDAQMKSPDQVELTRLAGAFDMQSDRKLMLLDATGHILRMNESMLDLLATTDLVMPAARAHPEQLIGHRLSDIMTDTALKTRLAWPKAFADTVFDIGDNKIAAVMHPLGYQPGLMLGWLLCLENVTQRDLLQGELHALIDSGLRGDFARRVDTEQGPADLTALARQMNNLYARINEAQNRLLLQLDAIGSGDLRLDEEIDPARQAGPFQEMHDLTDRMAVQWTTLVVDLVSLTDQIDQVLAQLQEEEDLVLSGATAEEDSKARRLQHLSLLQTHAENLARILEIFRTGTLNAEERAELLEGLRRPALVSRPQ